MFYRYFWKFFKMGKFGDNIFSFCDFFEFLFRVIKLTMVNQNWYELHQEIDLEYPKNLNLCIWQILGMNYVSINKMLTVNCIVFIIWILDICIIKRNIQFMDFKMHRNYWNENFHINFVFRLFEMNFNKSWYMLVAFSISITIHT